MKLDLDRISWVLQPQNASFFVELSSRELILVEDFLKVRLCCEIWENIGLTAGNRDTGACSLTWGKPNIRF